MLNSFPLFEIEEEACRRSDGILFFFEARTPDTNRVLTELLPSPGAIFYSVSGCIFPARNGKVLFLSCDTEKNSIITSSVRGGVGAFLCSWHLQLPRLFFSVCVKWCNQANRAFLLGYKTSVNTTSCSHMMLRPLFWSSTSFNTP